MVPAQEARAANPPQLRELLAPVPPQTTTNYNKCGRPFLIFNKRQENASKAEEGTGTRSLRPRFEGQQQPRVTLRPASKLPGPQSAPAARPHFGTKATLEGNTLSVPRPTPLLGPLPGLTCRPNDTADVGTAEVTRTQQPRATPAGARRVKPKDPDVNPRRCRDGGAARGYCACAHP